MLNLFFLVFAYLLGSISSAVIVCKLFSLPDPRQEGSKNPGATNVLRVAGKRFASYVLIADILKGFIPVVLAKLCNLTPTLIAFTALAAVLGHMYPIFLKFKGGKGVATAIGALLAFQIYVGVLVIATWLLVIKLSRYSSLASIAAIGLAPLYSMILVPHIGTFPPLFFIALLVLYKHGDNITRLMDGTEPKVKWKQNPIEEIIPTTPPLTEHEFVEPSKKKSTPKKGSDEPKPL